MFKILLWVFCLFFFFPFRHWRKKPWHIVLWFIFWWETTPPGTLIIFFALLLSNFSLCFWFLWGERKFAKMAWSDSLAPGFVGNDCATAEIAYSIALPRQELVARSRATLCCLHMWAPPRKRCFYCCVKAVSLASVVRGENIACLPLWLLCQLGENQPQF